jgi:hemerythrin superfamily protein
MNTQTPNESPQTPSYSGRSPEEIENEIDRTREELSRTLEALEVKLSPRERLRQATDSARAMGQKLARTARDSLTPGITTMIRLDHTHVLALFRRYKPWTSASRKRALVSNACLALEVHAQLEEEIFYPTLLEVAGHSVLLDKSELEHNEMRKLIGLLHSLEVGDPAYDDSFQMLMRTVLHHVADEESTLLPLAESVMPERLAELGLRMTKRRMELLRPNLGKVAATTVRSFPVASAAAAVGLLAIGWLIVRPGNRPH